MNSKQRKGKLKSIKESACWEATQFVFPSVLSGLDDCYYCSNIIVSLLFELCAKFSLWLQERSKVGACCRETDSICLTEKIPVNHQIIFFDLNFFWQHAPWNYLSGFCSEFFDLSCRSISLKLFYLYCSVFPRFCPRLSFHSFANLKLAFSLQKLVGNQEKQ